jgi:hypothetical protein
VGKAGKVVVLKGEGWKRFFLDLALAISVRIFGNDVGMFENGGFDRNIVGDRNGPALLFLAREVTCTNVKKMV